MDVIAPISRGVPNDTSVLQKQTQQEILKRKKRTLKFWHGDDDADDVDDEKDDDWATTIS